MQGGLDIPNLVDQPYLNALTKEVTKNLKREPCDSGSCYMMPKVKKC